MNNHQFPIAPPRFTLYEAMKYGTLVPCTDNQSEYYIIQQPALGRYVLSGLYFVNKTVVRNTSESKKRSYSEMKSTDNQVSVGNNGPVNRKLMNTMFTQFRKNLSYNIEQRLLQMTQKIMKVGQHLFNQAPKELFAMHVRKVMTQQLVCEKLKVELNQKKQQNAVAVWLCFMHREFGCTTSCDPDTDDDMKLSEKECFNLSYMLGYLMLRGQLDLNVVTHLKTTGLYDSIFAEEVQKDGVINVLAVNLSDLRLLSPQNDAILWKYVHELHSIMEFIAPGRGVFSRSQCIDIVQNELGEIVYSKQKDSTFVLHKVVQAIEYVRRSKAATEAVNKYYALKYAKLEFGAESNYHLTIMQTQLFDSIKKMNYIYCDDEEQMNLSSYALMLCYLIATRHKILGSQVKETSDWHHAYRQLEQAKKRFVDWWIQNENVFKKILHKNAGKLQWIMGFTRLCLADTKPELWKKLAVEFQVPDSAEFKDVNWTLMLTEGMIDAMGSGEEGQVNWDKLLSEQFGTLSIQSNN